MEKNADMQSVEQIWSLINLEVYLRCCRDLVANRFCKTKAPADHDEAEEQTCSHALQNIQIGSPKVAFWRPLQIDAVEDLEPSTPWAKVLKSQIMERLEEMQYYKDLKEHEALFAGTSLQTTGSSN